MAFNQDKKNAQKEQPVRKERKERKEISAEKKVTAHAVERTFSPIQTEASRASTFAALAKERLAERNNKSSVCILDVNDEIGVELSPDYGYIVLANVIENDCFWHLFIFESSNRPVHADPRRDDRNRREVRSQDEVFEYWATVDSVSDSVINTFERLTKANIAVDGDYIFTNTTVVPVEVPVDDKNLNVIDALCFDGEDSNILISDADIPFTADVLSDASTVRADLNFSRKDKLDKTGLPMRSDWQIEVTENFRDRSSNPLKAASGTHTIVGVDGYVNLRHAGQDELDDNDRNVYTSHECYTPEVVVTEVNTIQSKFAGGNFERTFLGLSMLPVLKDGDVWRKQFESNLHGDAAIKSLAYGMIWDNGLPTESELDKVDVDKFFDKVIHKDNKGRIPVDFALLAKEGNVGSSAVKLLTDFESGSSDAADKLVMVLDNLTNGVMGDTYPIERPEDVIASVIRVPHGYFRTKNDKKAIEYIDTIEMLDLIKNNDDETLNDILDSQELDERAFDEDTMLTKMVRAYNKLTDDEFVHKGFAIKIYFNPEFLIALYEAVQSEDAGIDIEVESFENYNRRDRGRRRYNDRGTGLTRNVTRRRGETHRGINRRAARTRYSR